LDEQVAFILGWIYRLRKNIVKENPGEKPLQKDFKGALSHFEKEFPAHAWQPHVDKLLGVEAAFEMHKDKPE
jgi:hypothetical protein